MAKVSLAVKTWYLKPLDVMVLPPVATMPPAPAALKIPNAETDIR
jgi:hypothetical protein